MTAESNKIDIPVLKAWDKVSELVDCVAENPYDRDGLRDDVLALYSSSNEKSVLRGMAIPTLRRLGLIVGYEKLIRLSANGMLLHNARLIHAALGKRTLAALIFEMDVESIGFVSSIKKRKSIPYTEFLQTWMPRVEAPSLVRARERIIDWLNFLKTCGFIKELDEKLYVNQVMERRAMIDIDYKRKERTFRRLFFGSYQNLVSKTKGIQSHPIEDLRAELAIEFLYRYKRILTEKQFDELLLRLPKTTQSYLIAFGRSMGADEKLFELDGKYYQTISIRKFDSR